MSTSGSLAPSGEASARVLADGTRMPWLGLGVFLIPDGPETENAVRWALEAGYRHIDTAQAYGNEASVGRALRESNLAAGQVFVTTKFDPRASDPVEEAERSLEALGIDRLDLYLVHWPQGGPTRAWQGMERALERGLTRSIGVSNFDVDELGAVIAAAGHPPVVNQVQFSPFQYRRQLLAECERRGVAPEAYSPLTQGADIGHPVVAEVARQQARTPAQVLLRWGIQRGLAVIPKSRHQERIVENSRLFDFSLTEEEMATLDALDRTGGSRRALEHNWWTLRGRARTLPGRYAGRLLPRRS